MKKFSLKNTLMAVFICVAAPASAQVDSLTAKKPVKHAVDSTLSAVLDSIVANKGRTTYRIKEDSALSFMTYPKDNGIGFLQFKDRNADSVFSMDEMTYAEYSDGFACIVVKDTGDGQLSVMRSDTARASIKTADTYKKAAVTYRKNPAPVDDALATKDWIVARLSRKNGIAK